MARPLGQPAPAMPLRAQRLRGMAPAPAAARPSRRQAPAHIAAKRAAERESPAQRELQPQEGRASALSNNITPLKRRPAPAAAEVAAGRPAEAPAPAPQQSRKSGGPMSGAWAAKPAALVLSSSYVLHTAVELSGGAGGPAWAPVLAGAAVGALYAALNRAGMARLWRAPRRPLNVVVTGGRAGIGKALAREFLMHGDRVFLTARSSSGLAEAVAALREEAAAGEEQVGAAPCDVSVPADVDRLVAAAQQFFGRCSGDSEAAGDGESARGAIDVWVNNAGYSGNFQSFLDASPETIEEVVRTNLLGTLLCSRAAMRAMASQPSGGHVFNMDGAGADGMATPQYAAYGATKAGIAHVHRTLQHETRGTAVAVHNLSPGMVLTPLLLEGASEANKAVFNILCEQPETAAAFLVPRARSVVARRGAGAYVRFLTLSRALSRFLTAPLRANRYFDAQGHAVYPPERERILGASAKRTERLAKQAARRSHALGVAYGFSLAASYLIIVLADSLAKG